MRAWSIFFTVPGQPGRKGRPRFTTVAGYAKAYTPKKTVRCEERVLTCFLAAARRKGIDLPITDGYGYISLDVKGYYAIPKSWAKWRREYAALEELPVVSKGVGDFDNFAKATIDALNGVAWQDDSHVAYASVSQVYSSRPRVEMTITYAPEVTRETARESTNA